MTRAPKARERSQMAFARLLGSVKPTLERKLGKTLTQSATRAERIGPEVSAMVEAVRSLSLRGGKRLRPALVVAGARATPEGDAALGPLLNAGVALELLQAFFLIHDDWMDEDDERRGGPTAHVWLGEVFGSKAQGARSAILAGDLSIALALQQLARLDVPAERLASCLSCFAEMQTAATHGQQLDVIGQTNDPELTYVLKTASYTVNGPLRLGALMAGAGPRTLKALERFALPAGIAFQLRDDLIGVFGDPALTGKPRGGDLRAGKRTYLVARALEACSRTERTSLLDVLGKKAKSQRALERALAILESSGARERTERRIIEHVGQAERALVSDHLTVQGKTLLWGALAALAEREA